MKMSAAVFHKSLFLDESNLTPPNSDCFFCGSTDRQRICELQSSPTVNLLKCQCCHACSASRLPTESALANYYSKYYDKSPANAADSKTTFDDSTRFGRHLGKTFLKHHKNSEVSILDYGGGDGRLSYSTALNILGVARKVDITVVDYNEDTVVSEDSRVALSKVNLDQISSDYDYVIASAIVEHLPDPQRVLNILLGRLKPGGIFYARTPYVVPFMKACSLLGIKIDFTYPAHLHDLGQDFWESYFCNVANKESYQLLQSSPSIVETNVSKHFFRTIAAYAFKAPWYLFGRKYNLVGGWEVFARKLT